MIDHVVVDVEIQHNPEQVAGGWDATDKLGVACAVVYEFTENRFLVYGPDDVPVLKNRLLRADRISGFNIWRFDLPVIWGMSRAAWAQPGDMPDWSSLRHRTDDVLARIWRALGLNPDEFTERHQGWGLHYVALGTLGRGKTGYGDDAPKWYQAGLWQKVVNYCLNDVALERDVVTFIDRHGYVVNGKTGGVLKVPRFEPGSLR
jgi:DEAD/DEAH box helicase domain-containing protein